MDRRRKKKARNEEWVNPHDPDLCSLVRSLSCRKEQMPGGWVLEIQGFGPAMNIRYSDYTDGNKNMEPIAPLGKGDRRTNLHNQISQALARPSSFEAEYESLPGLKYGTTVQRAGNSVQTGFYKLQEETYHEPNR